MLATIDEDFCNFFYLFVFCILLRSPSFARETVPQTMPTSGTSNATNDSIPARAENVASENVAGASSDVPGPSWAMPGSEAEGDEPVYTSSSRKTDTPISSSELTIDGPTANGDDDSIGSPNDIRRRRIQRFSSEPNASEGQQGQQGQQ